jgi:hypothetical protein
MEATYGDREAAGGGTAEHQKGRVGREAEADDRASPETHEDSLGKAGRQRRAQKATERLNGKDNTARGYSPRTGI